MCVSTCVQPLVRVATHDSQLVVFGKNDKRTRKGKIRAKSQGLARPKRRKVDKTVDPYYSLREWGKKQETPMTVEEVISMKLEKMTKKQLTADELFASVTPF